MRPTVLRERAAACRSTLSLGDDTGVTMVEVIVSALLVVIIAMGAFTAIEAASRTTAEESHRLQAHGLAEQDQARMRAMRISELSNFRQTRTVTEGPTASRSTYTIESRGDFVTNATGSVSCASGSASADYIRITSTVTWPSIGSRPPVVVQSIVTPPNGSIASDRGALAITVIDSAGNGVPGVGLSGSGAGSFSGTTDENGCALFGNLPQGNYTLSPSGIAGGLVDRDGNPPGSQTTSVVGQSTNQVTLQFAEPGSAQISFTMRRDTGSGTVAANARSVVAFNTGMTQAKAFPAPGGNPAGSITAGPLFPFSSPISFFAGACAANNPNPTGMSNPPAAAAIVNRTVSPGGTATGSVQLPALHATVIFTYNGWPIPLGDARVTVNDDTCSGNQLMADVNADSSGRAFNIALPWGRYNLCAEYGGYRRRISDVEVKDLTNTGTRRTIDLAAGTTQGSCP
jgi:Tfp pilus assembly protein PilV